MMEKGQKKAQKSPNRRFLGCFWLEFSSYAKTFAIGVHLGYILGYMDIFKLYPDKRIFLLSTVMKH